LTVAQVSIRDSDPFVSFPFAASFKRCTEMDFTGRWTRSTRRRSGPHANPPGPTRWCSQPRNEPSKTDIGRATNSSPRTPPFFLACHRTNWLFSAGWRACLAWRWALLALTPLHDVLAERQTVALWQTAVLYIWSTQSPCSGSPDGHPDGFAPANLPQMPPQHAGSADGPVLRIALWNGVGAPRAFGWITPVGGLLLLAGWSLIAMHGWRARL